MFQLQQEHARVVHMLYFVT